MVRNTLLSREPHLFGATRSQQHLLKGGGAVTRNRDRETCPLGCVRGCEITPTTEDGECRPHEFQKGTAVMRTTRKNLVGLLVACMIFAGMPFTVSAQDEPEGRALAHGESLEAGQLAVWEYAAWPATEIHFGEAPEGFTAAQDVNAWAPYGSLENAQSGACTVAEGRFNNDGFTSVTINGESFSDVDSCMTGASASTGESSLDELTLEMVADPGVYTMQEMQDLGVECRAAKSAANTNGSDEANGESIYDSEVTTELPAMSESGTGLAVPAGVCIDSGLLVVRVVQYGVGGWEDVRALNVGDGLVVYCGKHGQTAFDCWENYPSGDSTLYAACEQARGDIETVDLPGAFNYRFASVLFNGGPVPSVCS